MNKKIIKAAKAKEEYYAQFPDWYWKYGLHDAVIISVSETQLTPDYKDKNPKFNCFEIELDCSHSLGDRSIEKLRFYNYKIKTPDVDLNIQDDIWWLSDTLKHLENKHHLSEITLAFPGEIHKNFIIEYGIAEVCRKKQA